MFVGYLWNTAIYREDISVCREVIVSTDVGIKLEDPFQISLGSCPVKDGIWYIIFLERQDDLCARSPSQKDIRVASVDPKVQQGFHWISFSGTFCGSPEFQSLPTMGTLHFCLPVVKLFDRSPVSSSRDETTLTIKRTTFQRDLVTCVFHSTSGSTKFIGVGFSCVEWIVFQNALQRCDFLSERWKVQDLVLKFWDLYRCNGGCVGCLTGRLEASFTSWRCIL